ncbi:MAG TPA: ATP-binding cassette domain-containing protein [Acidobacteria bacterium]|nr:ATP-binding cassette domain-containing protein [Acidobacteriota bacterium]
MIEIRELSKNFASVRAVRSVSFRADKGEILGILGPNGAGKTTTLRILCGFLPPDRGQALVDGHDVVRESMLTRRMIGYLPESTPLYPEMRVGEYLRFRAGLKGVPARQRRQREQEAAELCGIADYRKRVIGTLSKGYRQRVGLADALVAQPRVLVLDEPTVGLDPNQVLEVRDLIRRLRGEHTILLSSHILPEVEQVCDRVVIFRKGSVIAEDSTEALRNRSGAGTRITVEIPDEQRDRLATWIEGLAEEVSREALDDGWLRVLLSADIDPRQQLFERAARDGLRLRELTRRQLSLEEIFHTLTTDVAEETEAAATSEEEQ